MIRVHVLVLSTVFAAALHSCALAPDKGARRGVSDSPVITIGTLTRVGRVLVNGFEWDTSAARVIVNGKPAIIDALRLGMVVRVEGVRDTHDALRGRARTLQHDTDLIGPLQRDSIGGGSVTATTMKIAGQMVLTDTSTRFDGFSAATDLEHNDVLEVSGYRDQAGLLHATWIKRVGGIESLVTVMRVTGTARDVKPTQFKIGDLNVLAADHIVREGDFVVVEGKWRVATPELVAGSVQTRPATVDLRENSAVILEGLVRTVSGFGFIMHGCSVVMRTATAFENGGASDLHEDGKVRVEGVLRGAVLEAARIVMATPK